MPDDSDYCGRPRCKNTAVLIYLGTPLCAHHWEALCAKMDEESERKRAAALLAGRVERSRAKRLLAARAARKKG